MKKAVFLILFMSMSIVGFSQTTYALASESSLQIEGTSTVHSWVVTANTLHGNLKATGKDLKEIDFEVEVADIKSERGATMDKKMHAALKKEEHPKVFFKLKEVKNSAVLVGELNIAGQEKTVEIPVQITEEGDALKIAGEHTIKLQDYNMQPPTAMFGQIVVGDDVTVKFDLVFKK